MIGRGKTFRITRLQMEGIISSKGPKYSSAWCGAPLREQHVSNHLPHRKSKRIQHCNNRHKNTDAVREHLTGSGDVMMTLSNSFPCISFTYIWILSASPIAQWPAVALLTRTFCRPLSLNFSNHPPPPKHRNADMLEHRPCGNNEMNQRGDLWRFQGSIFLYVHFICSELCVNISAKAEFEFGHSRHIWRIPVTWED